MNDLLSQDEIDALLRGDKDEGSDSNAAITPEEQDALGEIGNISMGTAATTLFTLLSHKVVITTPEVTVTTLNEMSMQYPAPFVAVEIQYTEGLKGDNLLIINVDDVKVITDLLMGGDGTNLEEELNELHLSAIGEVMNQMIGSSATSLASLLGKEISISPPNAFTIDFANKRPKNVFDSNEHVVKINFKMEIVGVLDSYIMQLIPLEFAKEMVGMLMEDQLELEPDHIIEHDPKPKTEPKTESVEQKDKPQVPHNSYVQETDKTNTMPVGVQPVYFEQLEDTEVEKETNNMNLILDVPLDISVELGKTQKKIHEILEFSSGSIIELDKMAGEPVDILVNGKSIAKGEVVVIDDNFGVRVTDIVNPTKRISHLR